MSSFTSATELFPEVCSKDFLQFSFGGRSYQDQLSDGIAKTGQLSAVRVEVVEAPCAQGTARIVWVSHNFGFLGGSLGCAEGEKITRAFEYAVENKLAVCVQCRSGGARMQEGTSSLMQMAKVSVAVEALQRARLPFIVVLNDPTYGGVSASYAMQADVKIAVSDARIGFAGQQVILNTMCEANQQVYDTSCPADFQSASYVWEHGQLDSIIEAGDGVQGRLVEAVAGAVYLLAPRDSSCRLSATGVVGGRSVEVADASSIEADKAQPLNYTNSRRIDRPQTQDIIANLFNHFVELSGDGRMGRDSCIRGGLCSFETDAGSQGCVVIATFKGHSPQEMQDANYGMASPHGYRTALRLMKLAERFGLPVVTLVDTVGAWPTFECERDGQSEAIATNLTAMAGLTVPIVTILAGEGGSGGALGIGMGNVVGMLSGGYFGVISPEGAASILGRYSDDADKAARFPVDCQELAKAQCIYADQLQSIGVVDEIIWESAASGQNETYKQFPVLKNRICNFLQKSFKALLPMSTDELIMHRYRKYRSMGTFALIESADERLRLVAAAKERFAALGGGSKRRAGVTEGVPEGTSLHHLLQLIAEETVSGSSSRFREATAAATKCPQVPPECPDALAVPSNVPNAKSILDSKGPEELARWVRQQKKVLLTDTTMRDAHQSLLATRVRTEDLVKGACHANDALRSAFSFECWGGATFDVAMRFLDECPWDRLRELRKAAPDVCLQMLIRGSNAVGYTSYPDNVVAEFIRLAAENGMDIFRIFDCFNDVDSMSVSIEAVRRAGKVAEVCLCYAGNVLTSSVYNLGYYENLARQVVAAGAHFIGIKDMAGLLRPLEVAPLLEAIRSVTDLPIHFHTHATSSGSLATCLEMARLGCDIVDTCTASMADGTSQPSLNAFLALTEGADYHPDIPYLSLEPYDMYWSRVRAMYSEFESGMLSGTARVYEHQIPGGQYSNLIVQCQGMGLWDRWEEVLDAYRDVNELFGDIVKVTPSSKCVGDLAIYLVTINMKAKDVLDPAKASAVDFPESVVGLMRGDLGFPHRGFPASVTSAVLKGASNTKRTVRAGLTLPPEDFAAHIAALSAKWKMPISPEKAMSSLMYPKVFSDYMTRQVTKGGELIRHLPTPVYLHGMVPGGPPVVLRVPVASGNIETTEIRLSRVCPLKEGKRVVAFLVNGAIVHEVAVKDSSGKFVYEGAMAIPGDASTVGSPMPGVVEKLLVSVGDSVKSGDVLCTVSAMKMEVKVSALMDGIVQAVEVNVGTRVVEGALMFRVVAK